MDEFLLVPRCWYSVRKVLGPFCSGDDYPLINPIHHCFYLEILLLALQDLFSVDYCVPRVLLETGFLLVPSCSA